MRGGVLPNAGCTKSLSSLPITLVPLDFLIPVCCCMQSSSRSVDVCPDESPVIRPVLRRVEEPAEDVGVLWSRAGRTSLQDLLAVPLYSAANGDVLLLSIDKEGDSSVAVYRSKYGLCELPSWLWKPPSRLVGSGNSVSCVGKLCMGHDDRAMGIGLEAWCSIEEEVAILQGGVVRTSQGGSMDVFTIAGCLASKESVSLEPKLSRAQGGISPKCGIQLALHACAKPGGGSMYYCKDSRVYHSSQRVCGRCSEVAVITVESGCLVVTLNGVDLLAPLVHVIEGCVREVVDDVAVRDHQVVVAANGVVTIVDFDTFIVFHDVPFVRHISLIHPIASLAWFPGHMSAILSTSRPGHIAVIDAISCELYTLDLDFQRGARIYPYRMGICIEHGSQVETWEVPISLCDVFTTLKTGTLEEDILPRSVIRAFRLSPSRAYAAVRDNGLALSYLQRLWRVPVVKDREVVCVVTQPSRIGSISEVHKAVSEGEFQAFARRMLVCLLGNLPALNDSACDFTEACPRRIRNAYLLRPKVADADKVGPRWEDLKGLDRAILSTVEELLGKLNEVNEELWEPLWALRIYCCLRFRKDLSYLGRVLGVHPRLLFGGIRKEQSFLVRILEDIPPESSGLGRSLGPYLEHYHWIPSLRQRGEAAIARHRIRLHPAGVLMSRCELRSA